MTNVFKYIIIEGNDGLNYPIIFSKLIQHVKMANRLCGPGEKVIGAGFLSIEVEIKIVDSGIGTSQTENIKYKCFGKSVSLKVESRGVIDSDIISGDYQVFG